MTSVEEWAALAERVDANPFVRPEWVLAWWAAFGRGRLEVVGARRDGRLVAAVPVVVRGGRRASPTNWHTPTFGAVVEPGDDPRALADALLDAAPRRLELDLVDADDPLVAALAAAGEARGYACDVAVRQRSRAIDLRRGWDAYEASLGPNVRRNARRGARRLARRGELELRVSTGTARLDEELDELFAVEAAGWKGRAGTAIRSSPETDRLYRSFAAAARDRGWLRLVTLRVAGRPVAVDLCIEHAGVHYGLKTGYDEAWASLSPGLVLRHLMIRRAFEEGLRRYELLGGDEPWKAAWADEVVERVRVRALAPGLVHGAERLARRAVSTSLTWRRERGRTRVQR